MASADHLAIVGCGFAGTSALYQAVASYPVKRITVFEASGEFGPGYPYRSDDCADYLLNNTTDTLCLARDNRRAFINWLAAHPEYGTDIPEKGHLPRHVYGAFLKDVIAATRTVAAIKGIDVVFVAEEVTGLRRQEHRLVLAHGGRETTVDAAILTTGRCPLVDPYPRPPAGSAALYVADHIRSAALDDVPIDATVHVLGLSLGAYDVVNRLFAPSTGCRFERVGDTLTFVPGVNERRVVLCSRSGRMKAMQSRFPRPLQRRHFTPAALRAIAPPDGLSLHGIAQAIVREAEAQEMNIDWERVREPYSGCATQADVQTRAMALLQDDIARAADPAGRNFLVDLFAQSQLDIWEIFAARTLSAAAERRYREAFETATLCYAAPCPISTAEKVLALMRAGRLSIVKGVTEVTFDVACDAYRITHDFGVAQARVLVNATGSVDRNVASDGQSPLVRDLVRQGLMRPYVLDGKAAKGADIDMRTLRLPASDNIYVANMLLWGPGFFTSSAYLMATFVGRILATIYAARR